MSTLQDILVKRSKLISDLEEITRIRDEAFKVFSNNFSLSEFQGSWEKGWKELFTYKNHQENNTVRAYLSWPESGLDHTSIQSIFYDISEAFISRDTFSEKLEPIRTAVEQYIEAAKAEIAEQDQELEKLYADFCQNCGEFAFFSTPAAKEIIFKHLLQV